MNPTLWQVSEFTSVGWVWKGRAQELITGLSKSWKLAREREGAEDTRSDC